MYSNHRGVTALLAACSMCLACNLPDLKLTLPDLCRTIQGVTLPPGSGRRETFSAQINEKLDLSRVGIKDTGNFEARLRLVQFTSHSSASLEWIEDAGAVLHGPTGSSLPDVALRYTRPEGSTAVGAITVRGGDDDLAPYLEGGEVKAELSFTGQLPETPASLDVKICFQIAVPLGGGGEE